jgi:hypothetical protein
LFVSLFEHYTRPVGKRRDPSKVFSPEAKNHVRRRRKNYLIPHMYLLKRYVRQEARINQIAKNLRKKWE